MAVKFKTQNESNLGFVNTWTQLKDVVSQKSLYNEADYQGLTTAQKEQYLLTLYENNDALARRLDSSYYSEYGDIETRYLNIMKLTGVLQVEKLMRTEEGRAALNAQFEQQFNSTVLVDSNQQWVKDLVDTKYEGNYAKFLQDYSSDNKASYENFLLEQLPSGTEVTQESFNETLTGLASEYETAKTAFSNQAITDYENAKQYINEKIQANARKQVYENAGAFEKTLNTIWQMPASWVGELGNIVEGVVDALAAVGTFDTDVRAFVEKDLIALDTAILNSTDASWLSPYADDNIAKTIHEVGVSIVDMTPLLIPYAGQAIYYTSSGGRTMENELRTGYSYGEALVYSIGSTALEYGVESISDSPFFKRSKTLSGKILDNTKIKGWYSKNKNWATEMVRQGLGEGLEEVVSEIGSGIMHGVVTGDYQLEGENVWKSFVMGGVVGAIMAGGNSVYRHAIVNKTKVRLTGAAGTSIDISAGKAAIVSNYIKTTTAKVKAGKTLSKREQTRYNVLKDIKVNAVLDRKGRARTPSIGILANVDEFISNAKYRVSTEAGYFDSLNADTKKTSDEEFMEQAAKVKAKADEATTNDDFVDTGSTEMPKDTDIEQAYNLTTEETAEKLQNEFITNGMLSIGKFMKLFGEDAVVGGIEGYSKYSDKTLDQIEELLTTGSEDSQLIVLKDDISKDIATLKKAFNDAEFMMVEPKTNSEIDKVSKALKETIRATKTILDKSKTSTFTGAKAGNIKYFVTMEPTVSTSFFIGKTLYINANWLTTRNVDFIKDTIVSKMLVKNAILSLKENDTRNLLHEIVNKMQSKSRSFEIVEQDIAMILFYTKNNPLMQQLLAMTNSKEDRNRLIKYFSDLATKTANVSIRKAANAVISNMVSCSEELYDLDSPTEDYAEQVQYMTPDEILNDYLSHKFRAFPGISGNAGLPVEYAKLSTMYSHFTNKFGFNKKLDLSKDVDWLAEFGNIKNYSEEGWNLLNNEINKFQPVTSNTGFELGTVSTVKSFNELLNYYLDQTCGLIVTRKGILSSNDFMGKIFNVNEIDLELSKFLDGKLPRGPIGKVGKFMTSYAKKNLSPQVCNIDIYLISDTNSSSTAFINGMPGLGMQIFLNVADIKSKINQPVDIGGVNLVLDSKTGLPIEKDGKYQVEGTTQTVSEAAMVFMHEIGHAISMTLNLHGTFSRSAITNTLAKRISESDRMTKIEIQSSIINWLFESSIELKPDKIEFANYVKDVKKWRNDILTEFNSSEINLDNMKRLLEPLSKYLYFTGFAHELYSGNHNIGSQVASLTRDDLIQSRLETNKHQSTVVLYLDDKFKKKAPMFLKLIDGHRSSATHNQLKSYIEQTLNSPENVTKRIYERLENVEQLKEEFGIEKNSDLINPDFWRGKLSEAKINVTDSNFMSRESLISDIEDAYDCVYQDETFVSGFIPGVKRFEDKNPVKNQDYSYVFYDDGSVKSTMDDSAFSNESNINTVAIYHPADGKRPADVTIRFNTSYLDQLTYNKLKAILKLVPDLTARTFIADGRTFNNAKAALYYLSERATKTESTEFETIFKKVMDNAITTGRQKQYVGDVIYVTSDGKIYNSMANMATWNGTAEAMNVPESLLGTYTKDDAGNFVTDNTEGITYNLSRLLDEKRVVRLYREGGSWAVYGVPNKLQDTLVRELNGEYKTEVSYIEKSSNRKLFVNSKGDQHVEIHGSNWKHPDFKEVEWHKNKWYDAICQIMTKYNINKFDDFKRLGFSKEFIQQLQSSVGTEHTNTRGEKYLQPGGITYQYILEYISDSSNTALSRNILIESVPDSTRDNKSGDWKRNAHIRTIEDAENYLENLRASGLLLQNDDTIYDNWTDFIKATAKASQDPLLVDANTANAQAIEKAKAYFGEGELLIRLLNADSYVEGRGLDISTDGFRIASSIILTGLDARANPETELSYTDSEGKEREKFGTTINPEDIVLAKDTIDPEIESFAKQILETREIADPEERDSALDTLLQYTYRPRYGDTDMSAIRNIIANERAGAKQSAERRKQVEKNLERVNKYKELEEDSPEQLAERKKLIRYYEQTRKFRGRLIAAEGGPEYYQSLLKSVVSVGGYHARMSQNFSKAYETYKENSAKWTTEQKASRDKQLQILKSYRDYFVASKDNSNLIVNMEYPGYYEHYELLYNMLRNWVAGHKGVTQNYLATNAEGENIKNQMFDTPKSFAAAQTDIINFINKWKADTEFRLSLAARERVSSYGQISSLRGARFSKPDLEIFKDIPEDLRDLQTFPKAARDFYNDLSEDVDDLANVLSNEVYVTDLVREFGDDYVYHLQRLYNDLTMPDVSEFRSESMKDMFTKIRAGAAKASGKSEEEIQEIKNQLTERMTKKPTYAGAISNANQFASGRYLSYRSHLADRLSRMQDKLRDSKPATDEQRITAIKDAYKDIQDFRWFNKKGKPLTIYELTVSSAWRVLEAVNIAYYNLLTNPKTEASIQAFKNDIMFALEEKTVNAVFFGRKKRELITLQVPKHINEADGSNAIIKEQRGGYEVTMLSENYIDEKLEPLLKGEIADLTNKDLEAIEKYRESVKIESTALYDYVNEYDNPYRKLERERKERKRIQDNKADVTVVKRVKYNVQFDNKTGEFKDLDGNVLNKDRVDVRMLNDEEYTKYLDYKIDEGISKGHLDIIRDSGNIVDNMTRRIVFISYALSPNSKYYRPAPVTTSIEFSNEEIQESKQQQQNNDSEAPNEEDFESEFISEFIEDPGVFEPIENEAEKPKIKQPKGSWSDTDTKGINNSIVSKLLSYEPKVDDNDQFRMSRKEFIEDNATYINEFRASPEIMQEYVSWVETNPAVPINSPKEAIIFALLNQVRSTLNAPDELRERAKDLIDKLASRSGRILGMAKNTGLTPVDQMIELISNYMNLTAGERTILEAAANMQRNAIKIQDYKAAEASMQKVLEIVKKHENELPTSCNIFAKGLTPEERMTRMHNITEKITSWRYFAMLGSPSTFFTKNIASNVIITGMDKVAELIASKLPQGKKLKQDYSFIAKDFDPIFGTSDAEWKLAYNAEYDRLFKERSVVDGKAKTFTNKETEELERDARNNTNIAWNEKRKSLQLLTNEQVQSIIDKNFENLEDRNNINTDNLTKYINDFIKTRHKTDGKIPTVDSIVKRANEYMLKNFGQYSISSAVQDGHKSIVKQMLIDNGLLDAIMNGAVSKYDRGYDVKTSAVRQITLDAEGKLDDISEKEASILADTINQNAPFKWELMNKWYRGIFKVMDWGDKKFIKPKIVSTVEKLVASNMTNAEINDLLNGNKAARRKFEDFVAYATNDAMKTYFREDTDFYKKLMQLFPKNPVAQLILGTLMPFPRMVINTMNTALSYSPIGFIKAWSIARNSTDAFTRLKINKELGKAITGSSLIAIGALFALAGWIGFDDDDEYGGAQIIIGNVRIALSDLSPSAIPLIIGATITHSATEGFWNGVTDGANALLDATILGEAINIFGGNQNNTDFIANSFTAYINQFIPSVFRHIARSIDPTKKDYSSNKAIKVFQRAAAAIPGVSMLVPSEVDPYTGDAQYQNTGADKGWAHILPFVNAFSPAKITTNIESDVEIESKAVDAATTGPSRVYSIDGVQYEIPEELYKEYQILRAKLYSAYARDIINTTAYKNMSLTQKKSKLKQLQTRATKEARKQLNIGK